MKKRKSIGLWVGICLLFLGIFGSVNVLATVTDGKAGETLTGEYAVIINTDTSDSRSAGTLIFDDSGSTASASSGSELPAAQSLAGLNAGSTSTVTALNEKSAISSITSADETDDVYRPGSDYHLCNRRREIYLQKQWQRQDLYMHWDW